MANELCLVVCPSLEAEVRAVVAAERWPQVAIAVVPGDCGRRAPDWGAYLELARSKPSPAHTIHLLGGACLAAAPPAPPELAHWHIHAVANCFEFLLPKGTVSFWLKDGSYLLTPGWLTRWREHMRRWGFDQAGARQFFGESVSRLVLLDSGLLAESQLWLCELGEFVQRPTLVLPVGLDYLRLFLGKLYLEWQWREEQRRSDLLLRDTQRKLSDYTMASDLTARLTSLRSEAAVIETILELFTMLFAPERLAYIGLREGKPEAGLTRLQGLENPPELPSDLLSAPAGYSLAGLANGFALRVGSAVEPVGVVHVDHLAFPQHQRHYVVVALSVASVCSLAIHNARLYERLAGNIRQLEQALAEVRTLRGLLPICSHCKKIRDDRGVWNVMEGYIQKHSDARFSHGLCPDCIGIYFPGMSPKE